MSGAKGTCDYEISAALDASAWGDGNVGGGLRFSPRFRGCTMQDDAVHTLEQWAAAGRDLRGAARRSKAVLLH
jgi:hypothetical protein